MTKYIYYLIAVLFLVGVVWLIKTPGRPGQYDSFAQCIKDKGAIFYGAFWCPHCQNQKARFGKSAKLLPYVECSTPDGKGQLPICEEKKITTYPTWYFASSTAVGGYEIAVGEIEMEDLASKTGCTL